MSCPRCGLDCHGMANIYANQNERLMAEMTSIESERDALQARVKRLEEALEFGVGLNRSKELMSDNHIVGVTELVKRTKEVPCPDCYGGHFKPCKHCGEAIESVACSGCDGDGRSSTGLDCIACNGTGVGHWEVIK